MKNGYAIAPGLDFSLPKNLGFFEGSAIPADLKKNDGLSNDWFPGPGIKQFYSDFNWLSFRAYRRQRQP
jgi:hypothetical protein